MKLPNPTNTLDLTAHHMAKSLFDDGSLLKALFLQSPDAVVIAEAATEKIIIANQKAEAFFGAFHNETHLPTYLGMQQEQYRDIKYKRAHQEKVRMDCYLMPAGKEPFTARVNQYFFELNPECKLLICRIYSLENVKNLEQTASLNRQLFDVTFYQSNQPKWLRRLNSHIEDDVICNEAALQLFEVKDVTDFYPNFSLRYQAERCDVPNYFQTLREKKSYRTEQEYVTARGRRFWGRFQSRLLTFDDQEYILTTIDDLSDQWELLHKLSQARKSAEEISRYYRNILDAIPNPIFVKTLDQKFIFANKAFGKLVHKPTEEIINQPEAEVTNPIRMQEYMQMDKRVAEAGKTLIFEELLTPKEAGGETDDSQIKHLLVYKTPFYLENGQTQIIGAVVDISEAYYSTLLAKEKDQLFFSVFESTTDALFLVDPGSQKVLNVNQAACHLFGYEAGEMIGKKGHYYEKYPLDDRTIEEGFRRLIQKTFSYREVEYIKKNQTCFWGELTATYFKAVDTGYILVRVRDITEERTVREEINRNLAEKETLLKEVHHRVKNNMAVISGLLQLQAQAFPNPLVRKAFKESQTRIRSMALIHEQLYKSPSLSAVALDKYIKELAAHLQRSYPIDAKVNIGLDVMPCHIDITRAVPVGLVINELTTNAFKHAFVGRNAGEVFIGLYEQEQCYLFEVRDDGVGQAQEETTKNPQDYATEDKLYSMGLVLVQELVDQLKGNLTTVSNENGTTHLLLVPKYESLS